MTAIQTNRGDRIMAAAAAAALQALLLYALIAGLAVKLPHEARERLVLLHILPEKPPPPEKIVPPPERKSRPEGKASPPNLRSKATPVVAPPRVVELPVPQTIVTAPRPGPGDDPSSGAADIAGPGQGAGGEGNGFGGGGYGDGDGGGGRGRGTPPRLRQGRIRDRDYPAGARRDLIGGTVTVLYTVAVSGRVTKCDILRSSGSAELDETTCRLIMERFRYEPSRDPRGRPVQSRVMANHSWIVDEREAEPDDWRRRD